MTRKYFEWAKRYLDSRDSSGIINKMNIDLSGESFPNAVYPTIEDIPASEQEPGNQVYVEDAGDGEAQLVIWKE